MPNYEDLLYKTTSSLKSVRNAGKLLVLLLVFASTARADESVRINLPVSEIIIIGNELTGTNVIRRELLFTEGDTINAFLLERSRQRILNLYLFNRVEMMPIPQEDKKLLLLIEVTERLYFYPVPILTMRERDWKKWSYGASLVHSNFRGQNERLWAGIWFGYRPGFGVSYTDPWLGDSLHLTTSFMLNKTTYNHRTLDFEEKHLIGNFSLGKWWGLHFKTELALNVDRISVDDSATIYMKSGEKKELLIGLQAAIRYDTRDLYSYPSQGWLGQLSIFRSGFFSDYNHYWQFSLDLRTYKRIGPLIAALRAYQTYLSGDVPVFRLNYLGFEERVRGHFFTQMEGRNINLGSVEIRFPLIPVKYFSLRLPPVPDNYLHNLKIGLSAGLFADAGIIWNDPGDYNMQNVLTGFGAGLHFHMPYIEIFRIDYAFNTHFQGQIIVEVGVSF